MWVLSLGCRTEPVPPPPVAASALDDDDERPRVLDTQDTADPDIDGDGLVDDQVDRVLPRGVELCMHADLIDWDGGAWFVGYGFSSDQADWEALDHPAEANGDWLCRDFEENAAGRYRVTLRGEAETDWARLDTYCPTQPDPLCWENEDLSYALCFTVEDAAITAADCEGT